MDELLTTKQVQEHLQVDRTTIYRMLKDGRLEGIKVGKSWRFSQAGVETLLSGASTAPPTRGTPLLSRDILPVYCLQAVQDVSAETVEVGAVTTDTDGLPITEISNSCRFCTLILSTESGRQACIASWRQLVQQHETHPHFMTCHAGFQYAHARIEVEGAPPAMLIAGQFFTAPPDPTLRQAQIQQLAQKHGIALEELNAAERQPRILDETKQAKITVWLEKLADTFAILSMERADMLNRLQQIADLSGLTKEL
ncbi:MAG: PocR ligand-binding domain-containing protein [Anaerolinea sp.]|nr:PocR ligand-binding domain-containing protein [Anaerolinea sp.]